MYATVHRDESVAPTREALRAYGERVHVEKIDILDPADRARAAAWDVDVLINNAALSESGALLAMDVDRVRRVFDTNVHATLALTQAVVRGMIARNRHGARVILIGSIMGVIPTPYRAPYGMSKWALEDLAHSLRGELAPFGISVVQINSGAYATGFNRESAERMREWMKPNSLYRPHEADIRKAEAAVQRLEVRDTAASRSRSFARWKRDVPASATPRAGGSGVRCRSSGRSRDRSEVDAVPIHAPATRRVHRRAHPRGGVNPHPAAAGPQPRRHR